MNARVTTMHVRDSQLDRVLRLITDIAMPAAERQEGFAAFILLSNEEAGKVTTTSLWRTEADMLASERAEYFQDQIRRLTTFLPSPPDIEHYRIAAML
jgi:quinol monooxygenase YgiN